MTAVLFGGTRLRHEALSAALGEPVTWCRPAEAAPGDAAGVRLVVLCPDTLAEQSWGNVEERLKLLRSGVLASILPLKSLATADWCRIVWTVSSDVLAGTADPVRSAIEHAALGAMRNVTREYAARWSTAAVVLDAVPPEPRERRFAEAAAMLADPATRFYSGQVLRLTEPSGVGADV